MFGIFDLKGRIGYMLWTGIWSMGWMGRMRICWTDEVAGVTGVGWHVIRLARHYR